MVYRGFLLVGVCVICGSIFLCVRVWGNILCISGFFAFSFILGLYRVDEIDFLLLFEQTL